LKNRKGRMRKKTVGGPFYGTATMQHCFKSFGKLQHYAGKAQDVDDLGAAFKVSLDHLHHSQ